MCVLALLVLSAFPPSSITSLISTRSPSVSLNPLGVNWNDDSEEVREYELRVMVFHLVNAAQALVRLGQAWDYNRRRTDLLPQVPPEPPVKLRDISIGLVGEDARFVIECSEPPGHIIWTSTYHTLWDVESDDVIHNYPAGG